MINAGTYKSDKFIMRSREFFGADKGLESCRINCVSLSDDSSLIAGTDCGLYRFDGSKFTRLFDDILTGKIGSIEKTCDSVFVSQDDAVYCIKGNSITKVRSFDYPVIDVVFKRDLMWVLTEYSFILTDISFSNDLVNRPLEGGRGICIAVSDREMYIATEDYLSLIHGKRREWKNIIPAYSKMPDKNICSLSFDSNGYLWLGTRSGSVIYDTASRWIDSSEIKYLPKNPVYKTVFDKSGGIYFATDVGAAYLDKGKTKYFSADRWLPSNKVNDIAVSDSGEVIYAATDEGLSVIKSGYTTLSGKAAVFEDIMEKYHIRRGFTANREGTGYNIEDGRVHISDNDGLWTACYVAAESFRYAVTGEADALEKARRGMNALLFLNKVSGIPGFTARAVRYPGEKGYGNGDNEWAPSPDGECEWKGETSSDEITGHFFGLSIYYDLCADDDEKEKIKEALCAVMDHIIDNNYRLIDRDGLPTTWACWNPDALNHDERWFSERGINSLELLGYLKVCSHISGDEKYSAVFDEFVSKHHYPLNIIRHKVRDAHYCHIDDNLGFLATMTYLRLEENEMLRSLALCGLEDHWDYEKPERQPLFSMIHAAFTGRDSDICDGIQSLREMPYDMIHYKTENSGRLDLEWDNEEDERHGLFQVKSALPYDEMNLNRPDSGSFHIDSRGGHAQEPTIYLLPYWIGRYYGIINED